ncbi:SRPBCC domain-containing protein [Fulvivirgaceae bacterium BMA10]|uniref:SRPBCC domain-containing protein n=1 Tax=Splendidivirga corallicola TaxID=3051826 RepID=A0ABT8KSG7_9BACT|nr:SRPBCC domain-containing protein [Fulvivirgaceae bacterium BMA10]
MTQNKVYLKRTLNHPIERVFHAFTKPEYITNWFGPINTSTTHADMEFVEGGQYRFQIKKQDNSFFYMQGTYQSIIPPTHLSFTVSYEGLSDAMLMTSIVSINFTSKGTGTEISLVQSFESVPKDLERRTQSWEHMLERLNEMLKIS